jgi:geranylgeranyl diphosphate synthase type II
VSGDQKHPDLSDATALLAAHGQAVSGYFASIKGRYPRAPARLLESIEYSLLAGGKRLRPALVMESARACGSLTSAKNVLAAAAAIELIHTFSLVHDDLPAMDDDDLRRGRPTNHKVYGEALAILAGDAMVTMAFEILAREADLAIAPALIAELASAAGPDGMIGGQVLDMEAESQPLSLQALQRVHRLKTGALITAACRMGAIAAGAPANSVDRLTDFGRHVGLVFQIVDDLLDVTATPQQLGKATNKDAARGKNTYPRLIGIDASHQQAQAHLNSATQAISAFGEEAGGLRSIAQFVVLRQS